MAHRGTLVGEVAMGIAVAGVLKTMVMVVVVVVVAMAGKSERERGGERERERERKRERVREGGREGETAFSPALTAGADLLWRGTSQTTEAVVGVGTVVGGEGEGEGGGEVMVDGGEVEVGAAEAPI